MRAMLLKDLLLISSMLVSITLWPTYLCWAKDSMGMDDKDSNAKPGWGDSDAGLAGFVPFDGPKTKFYPPWKIPKPMDVSESPLGNFNSLRSAPVTLGTSLIGRKPDLNSHTLFFNAA